MDDSGKTKEQLLEELTALRQRVAQLAVAKSQQKETEAALRKSEARFALAMQGTDEGVWDWDIVTNEAYFAPRFRELLGYQADEFWETLEGFTARLHPDDYDGTQAAIRAHLDDRKPYDREYRLQTKSGQYRWFHERGQAVWDEQGNPVRMAGSIRDITEHKQMEEALRMSEARFRSLSDASPIGIFQNDMTGACIYTNPRWQEISGVSLEESLGSNWGKRIIPEDREITFVEWETCFRKEREFSCEFRIARPDGEVRWIHARAAPVRSDQGVAIGYVGTAEDITKRKQAEEALRASEARFRSLSTFSPVGIYQTDSKGQCVYTNSRWQEIAGLSEAASLGDGWTSVIDPRDKDDVFTAWQLCVAKNQPFIHEFRFCRPNGEVRWVHSRAAALHSDTDVDMGHVGTVIDITERKRAEEEILRYTQEVEEARTRVEAQAAALTKKTEELSRSNIELDQFAYIASHDLQEPLRKIQAFSDRLETKYAAALDERGLDYLERMRSSAQRMQTLIKDLLTYARVTSKACPLVSVDLAVLAHEVVTVQAQPVLAGTPAAYQITIQDNGIGFDEEYRERIFAPFQRLHGRGQYEGTGIGLAVCRKIVRRHSGDITVASVPGQGSTFTVTLPVSPPAGDTQLL